METDQESEHASAQRKLMQPNNTDDIEDNDKKKGKGFDLKIEIYIRGRGSRRKGAPVKRYTTDCRKCCLCLCILVIILLLTGAAIFCAIYFTIRTYFPGKTGTYAETKLGTINGKLSRSPQGQEVEEYLGIPFAKPPIGDLRYSDPEPVEEFPGGEYMADDMKYSCMQFLDTTYGDFPGSDMWNAKTPLKEDCLYLHIWVPVPRRQKRAVMVWIYGGGFYSGSNSLWVYDGKALAVHGDVIVVSLNYRVGSFGFLSTGDGRIKGNFGLKDQMVAMQWIQDNIEAFGGDPELVTLFGESSGAASIGYHMMSHYTEPLFKRAIYESGSPDSHWSYMTRKQATKRSEAFFKAVNCTHRDTDVLLDCLRKHPAEYLLNNEWVDSHFMVFPWAPTVDGDFVADSPHNLLKDGKFQRKDSLIGVNKDEGTFWILYSIPGLDKDHQSLLNYQMYEDGVDIIDWDVQNPTLDTIKKLYSPADRTDKAANRDALDGVCGDRSFTCPTRALAKSFTSEGVKTYFYYLTYRASNEPWPPWMGVIHGAEIQWVFGMAENKSRGYSEEEIEFTRNIMSYWANFAKYGSPNSPSLPHWPQYTQNNSTYLEIQNTNKFIVHKNATFRKKYCAVWDEVNREYMRVP